jgi:hypothetical protein
MPYVKIDAGNLAATFNAFPLILAGPILRRVTATSVTVWVALKEASTVMLSVLDEGGVERATGTATARKLGAHLFVSAVTATTTTTALSRGTIYRYNLSFTDAGGAAAGTLKSSGIYSYDTTPADGLCYRTFDLPSFVIPAPTWQELRFLHGSCRKIHGQGLDALPVAGAIISDDAANAAARPQFLLMTGDQIYADDVAPAVLHMLRDVGPAVLGRTESLPGVAADVSLAPGARAKVVIDTLFMTSEKAASHLVFFDEFCAMYLMAWSDVLWPKTPEGFPTYEDVYGRQDAGIVDYLVYGGELNNILRFYAMLREARKVLANIACYMICDDHEVTDDWYVSADWCARVLGNEGGRRVIENALAAYAVFQAWGNTPEQFDTDTKPGGKILLELGTAQPDLMLVDACLTIPPKAQIFSPNIFVTANPTAETDLTNAMAPTLPKGPVLHRPAAPDGQREGLNWHYTVNGANYQIIVLDTRTWRSFPGPLGYYPPQLLSDAGWEAQVATDALPPAGVTPELTIVVSPAVPLGIPASEFFQSTRARRGVLEYDVEGWTSTERAFQQLLAKLATRPIGVQEQAPRRRRVVILSGDVHHGFGMRLQYWASKPYEAGSMETQAVFAMLTASAFKNQDILTWLLHHLGYDNMLFALNLREYFNYFGWENAAKAKDKVGEVVTDTGGASPWNLSGQTPEVSSLEAIRHRAGLPLNGSVRFQTQPEWRYHVEYLNSIVPGGAPTKRIDGQGPSAHAEGHKQHRQCVEADGAGMQIVGRNNIGEITFAFNDGDPRVRVGQRLWWREPESGPAASRTFHLVSLDFADGPDPMTRVIP